MTIARTVGLGLGIMFLLGVGAVSLSRAQQAGDKAVSPTQARSDLRERVLTLRIEIDLLQLDYDADRAPLVDWIKDLNQAESGNDNLGMEMLKQIGAAGDADAQMDMSKEELAFNKVSAKAISDVLRSARKNVDHKKKEFGKKTRVLNEKKPELKESEAKYTATS
jgi:hypothetical protein